MSEIPISIDAEIFNPVYLTHLENNTRTQIFYGGASSGKSVFVIAQRTIIDILGGGRNYLVCRAVGKYLRKSVFNEIEKTIKEWGLSSEFTIHKTEMTITCANGYQIIFIGLDDEEKIKSITPAKGALTDILVEEATEISEPIFKQLNKRLRGLDLSANAKPKRITLVFNPILKSHWIYKMFFAPIMWEEDQTEYSDGKLSILKTTYKDNKFLTRDDREALEDETDPYYHDVYTLGNWGVLGDVIFTNWKVQDLSDIREGFDNIKHGLDFGFSSDPVYYGRSHFNKNKKIIYILDEYSDLEVSDEQLADEIKDYVEYDTVVCDSAEPKSIAKLNELGISAIGARKGPDSIRFGIKWLKSCTIIIDSSCVKAKQMIELYQWKKNKYGERTSTPLKKDDHFIDQLRYAYEDEMEERVAGFVNVEGL